MHLLDGQKRYFSNAPKHTKNTAFQKQKYLLCKIKILSLTSINTVFARKKYQHSIRYFIHLNYALNLVCRSLASGAMWAHFRQAMQQGTHIAIFTCQGAPLIPPWFFQNQPRYYVATKIKMLSGTSIPKSIFKILLCVLSLKNQKNFDLSFSHFCYKPSCSILKKIISALCANLAFLKCVQNVSLIACVHTGASCSCLYVSALLPSTAHINSGLLRLVCLLKIFLQCQQLRFY